MVRTRQRGGSRTLRSDAGPNTRTDRNREPRPGSLAPTVRAELGTRQHRRTQRSERVGPVRGGPRPVDPRPASDTGSGSCLCRYRPRWLPSTPREWIEECFERSAGLAAVARLRSIWRELRDVLRSAPDAMCHGDLTPGNVLMGNGRLVGVIDVGGFGAAELHSIW
jgi:Phosphotransferase enzyme family